MCKHQVSMCVQMAERRAAASTQKQPWGEKKYMYLFECMDVCLSDNPPPKLCRVASPGGFFAAYIPKSCVYIQAPVT